ncbi:endothelin receptor type B-like [Hyperolius riggenbachi]|uniref:endothelin receptor type B-like n=1 Tax=Hyperolius riggenbachi TaxID=752182 RepID=UPI0035A2E689
MMSPGTFAIMWMACLIIGAPCQLSPTPEYLEENSELSQSINQTPADDFLQQNMNQNTTVQPCEFSSDIKYLIMDISIIFSCATFLVGIVGNSTLLIIICKNKRMRNGPNILIASLAFGDIFFILTLIPKNISLLVPDNWLFGFHLCMLVPFIQKASVGVTVLSLCALSIDRYRAVASWNRIRGTGITLWRAIELTLIWAVAIILAVPEAFTYGLEESKNPSKNPQCKLLNMPSSSFMKFYLKVRVWWFFVFSFCLPLACTGIFYTLMSCEMLRIKNRIRTSRKDHMSHRKKVAKTVLFLVAIFALCWFPLHVTRILSRLLANGTLPRTCELERFFFVMDHIAMNMGSLNSSINPVALYFVSRQFKKYFQYYLCCCCHRPRLDITPRDGESSGGTWKSNSDDLILDRSNSQRTFKESCS